MMFCNDLYVTDIISMTFELICDIVSRVDKLAIAKACHYMKKGKEIMRRRDLRPNVQCLKFM